jgi:hypothetical protein
MQLENQVIKYEINKRFLQGCQYPYYQLRIVIDFLYLLS